MFEDRNRELKVVSGIYLRLERWLGEPVKCLIINTNLFITNKKDYPVLSRAHQELIRKFLQLDVQYIIKGKDHHGDISQYCTYINFLGKKLHVTSSYTDFIQGCEDYLQNPLQPLSENLETLVYEVFERDPHKYNQYQLAIQKALEDKRAEREEVELTVMVLGAGRGPLIRAVLNAGEITSCRLKVYAVEKNPHAVNTLYALVRELWPGKVTVIPGDMRSFTPTEKADILVSELLGSFGDNELSPECLDGAQRFLKDDGISIPTSYTSWIAPVQSLKLYSEIRTTRPSDKTLLSCFETPYVVHIVNKYNIANTQELFTFIHPNRTDDPIDNKRYGTLRFNCAQNCVLTGLAGYFTCDLYKGIMLSTEPNTHTRDMMSWFPIFFPVAVFDYFYTTVSILFLYRLISSQAALFVHACPLCNDHWSHDILDPAEVYYPIEK
ncbi:capsuleen [Carabus blaptoides fortunei]